MGLRLTVMQRFWAKTKQEGSCIVWTAAKSEGYGIFAERGTKTMQAHRWLYLRIFGPLAPGLDVMHSCDNRACIALQHLSPGSRKMNMQDAVNKGRTQRGADRPLATLTDEQVVELRMRRALGETMQALADAFGVSLVTAFRIIHGERWLYVGGPIQPKKPR